ncbi:MAG: murein hydrolase activator EnvC family protein [Solirubrobacteraceae bacterium]|nr:MAG: hypothetical protein DLM63_08220 [Solirubrobacterales bacterium]
MRPDHSLTRARSAFVLAVAGAILALSISPSGAAAPNEQALQAQVQSLNSRLAQLPAQIAPLEAKLAIAQARLDSDQAELTTTIDRRRQAEIQLHIDEKALTFAQNVLAQQLVAQYESDEPDIVTVVLESNGFADLVERLDFIKRVAKHNTEVSRRVHDARVAVANLATRLGQLQAREYVVTRDAQQQRNQLDAIRVKLVDKQIALVRARNHAASVLHGLQVQRALLAARAARAASVASSSAGSAGSFTTTSGGGFVFPLPAGAATPPSGWSLDQGVDISAPAHTPELAVASGTVVLHGIGGFGSDAPVLHLDSGPYVYYGHAGPGNAVSIGTHVSAGQPIAEIGAGIVGISTGPHLEIGFCDASGTPTGAASQMQSLLLGAYH